MAYYGTPVTPALLFLPAVIAVQVAFTLGIALLLAMGNLFYRDVKYLFEVTITVWMFATAVVYPVELVGGTLGRLMMANPMTPIVDAHRAILLRGEMPATGPFLLAAMASFVTLSISWLVFHRGEFEFAEYV